MSERQQIPTNAPGVFGDSPLVVPLLLGILGLVFFFRIFFASWVNLLPDECSYWTWSRRLDWSYFDNSGMTAYLIRLSTEIFGKSTPFTVRLPFLILSSLTTYLVYRVGVLLFSSRRRALVAATVYNLTPAGFLGGAAAMHDNALMFFWMLTLYAAAQLLRSGRRDWFLIMGLATGLAIQSKYTGVLLMPCIVLFLLVSQDYRRHLLSRELWLGFVVALTCLLPILLWNAAQGWASFYHILFIGSGAASLQQRLLDGLGYHLAQVGIVSPLIYFAFLVGAAHACYEVLRRRPPEQMLLLCFAAPLVFFGIMAFRGHVEANWAFMGYASLLLLSVEIIGKGLLEKGTGIWRLFNCRFQMWALGWAVVPVFLVVLHAWVGLIPAEWEKKWSKEDRIVWETRGWDELGRHVGALMTPNDVIAADSYQLCALLEFNVPGQPKVRYLAPWNRPTQFDVWEPSYNNLAGRNIILVSSKPMVPSSPERSTIFENFSQVEVLPGFQVMYHGVAIREVYLYRGHNFNPSEPRRLGPRSLKYTAG